jgi:hypothetical protein
VKPAVTAPVKPPKRWIATHCLADDVWRGAYCLRCACDLGLASAAWEAWCERLATA